MKKLEKLSNQTFQTLEKSQMNLVIGGKEEPCSDKWVNSLDASGKPWDSTHSTDCDGKTWTQVGLFIL